MATRRGPLGDDPLPKASAESPPPTKQVAASGRSKGRIGARVITAYVAPEVHRALTLLGFEQEKKLQPLFLEALDDLFEKYGKNRIAAAKSVDT